MIEGQYPRDEYKQVFDSILCIQNGQIKSLSQQDTEKDLDEESAIAISAEKGGTSVLADAYLVCGDLDEGMFEFAFGFGFILQLIDDLQDVDEDLKNGHMTVFSRQAGKCRLDDKVNKLIAFTKSAIGFEKTGKSPYVNDIKKLIVDNCILMMFEAVSKNRKYFTRKYIRFIGSRSNLSFSFFKNAKKKINRKIKPLKEQGLL
jgi:hypothetical protein